MSAYLSVLIQALAHQRIQSVLVAGGLLTIHFLLPSRIIAALWELLAAHDSLLLIINRKSWNQEYQHGNKCIKSCLFALVWGQIFHSDCRIRTRQALSMWIHMTVGWLKLWMNISLLKGIGKWSKHSFNNWDSPISSMQFGKRIFNCFRLGKELWDAIRCDSTSLVVPLL